MISSVKFLSCWFATSYGDYTDALRHGLERVGGLRTGVIASNCGCGDAVAEARIFKDDSADYFEVPHVTYFNSANPVKRWLRHQGGHLLQQRRARGYQARSGDADVLHFQQTLGAYGSMALFAWLRLPTRAARVVTVHELDPHQRDHPEENRHYDLADRIIVHTGELRDEMAALGIDRTRIDVVLHGAAPQPPVTEPRAGLVFYGGHKTHTGKGFEALCEALQRLVQRRGARAPTLTVHGHYGTATPQHALDCVRRYGVETQVRFLNQVSLPEFIAAYRRARLMVLPYTGSFAGMPAANALANGLPVVATRRAGLPEHLGEVATWVPENDPAALAEALDALLEDEVRWRDLSERGLARAAEYLTWDAVAAATLESYRRAQARRTGPVAA
jgi:glycosyltransferase involved in cell wall biosynthesis